METRDKNRSRSPTAGNKKPFHERHFTKSTGGEYLPNKLKKKLIKKYKNTQLTDQSTNITIHKNDSQFNNNYNQHRFISSETVSPTIDEEPYESDYFPRIQVGSPTF